MKGTARRTRVYRLLVEPFTRSESWCSSPKGAEHELTFPRLTPGPPKHFIQSLVAVRPEGKWRYDGEWIQWHIAQRTSVESLVKGSFGDENS